MRRTVLRIPVSALSAVLVGTTVLLAAPTAALAAPVDASADAGVTATAVPTASTVPAPATAPAVQDLTIDGGAALRSSAPRPSLSGSSLPGSEVAVSLGGITFPATVDDEGRWSATATAPLPDGDHPVAVSARAADGTPHTATAVLTLVTTPYALFVDGGAVTYRDAADVTVTGTTGAPAGTPLTVRIDADGQLSAAVAADGTWSVAVPGLPDGRHLATASLAGIDGVTVTAAQTVVVDASVPVVTIDGGVVDGSVRGTSGEPVGRSVVVSLDGAVAGRALVDGAGAWTLTRPAPPADGTHVLAAAVSDGAHTVSETREFRVGEAAAPTPTAATAPMPTVPPTSVAAPVPTAAPSPDVVAPEPPVAPTPPQAESVEGGQPAVSVLAAEGSGAAAEPVPPIIPGDTDGHPGADTSIGDDDLMLQQGYEDMAGEEFPASSYEGPGDLGAVDDGTAAAAAAGAFEGTTPGDPSDGPDTAVMAAPNAAGGLAYTGVDPAAALGAAAALLVAGSALVVATRRRAGR